jgi:transcription antitermination factor NusG
MKNWLAVYTNSRSEKKVAQRLTDLGLEIYCPLKVEYRIWSDRKKKVEVPVFPSYVFVHLEEVDRLKVLDTPGVVNFVFWLGKPAIIRDNELDAIKKFLTQYESVKSRNIDIKRGQKVKITQGQLIRSEGVITEIRNKTVILKLEGIGFELYAEVGKQAIKKN